MTPGRALAALLGAAAIGAATSRAATDPVALLPAAGFSPGWIRAGAPVTAGGSDLYNLIDGAAEVFLELGFERVAVQEYAHGRDSLSVEAYVMSDEIAAAGAYLLKCGPEEHHPGIPGRHAFSPRQVILYRDNVLVVVTDVGGGAEGALVSAAAAAAALLPPERPLPLADVLPLSGRRPGTLRIARGPFSLQRVYTFGAGDVLRLGDGAVAVAAGYDDGRGETHTRIVALYPDEAAAAAAFADFGAGLDASLTVVRVVAGVLVFRDAAGRFGTAQRTGARLEIAVDLVESPGP